MRIWSMAIILGLVLVTGAAADEVGQFRWKTGEVLTYRIEHISTVTQTIKGSKAATTSKLNLVKRWKVLSVDDKGVATVEMSLVSMKNEQIRPNKEKLHFDSEHPGKSTPALRDAMMKFIGKPLATLKIDASGRVLEGKPGPVVERYAADPPFALILPESAAAASKSAFQAKKGTTWQRSYTVTLAPPQGTGEKYDAVQSYEVKSHNEQYVGIAMKTTFKKMPESQLDRIPLFQKQPAGTIIFDHRNGRLHSAQFRIDKTIENFQGPGSSYQFESKYLEEYVPSK